MDQRLVRVDVEALGSPATVPALLEVLLPLPEEVDSRHLKLGWNRHSQIKQMLSLSVPHIAQFLHSMLVEEGLGVARQFSVFKCHSSCIQLLHSTLLSAGFSSDGLSSVCVVFAKVSAATTRGLRRLHDRPAHQD